MKRLVTGWVVVSLMAIALLAEQGWALPPAYDIVDLGAPHTVNRAYGINDVGDVAGESRSTSNSLWHATVWTNGVASDLGTFGGTTSVAWDITNDGRVVGRADLGVGAHAFLYEDGVLRDLGVLAGSYSFAREIAENGVIVGGSGHAFLWQNGNMSDLDSGATSVQSQAFAINANSQIVGERADKACLWENGVPTNLGTLPGFGTSVAYDINDAGHVAGFCGNGDAAFLWKEGVMTNLGSLVGQRAYAHALNNHDQVVGQAFTATDSTAFIWENGSMVDLSNLLAPNSNWALRDARDINDSGQIVGCGINPDGLWHAYRLDPIPEPATLEVHVDIKPESCRNPLNVRSKGVLPVAICGTEDFDVMTLDPETLLLGREGIEDALAPIRWAYEDVATPFEGEPCDRHGIDADGYLDLTLKFDTQDLVELLTLRDEAGEVIPLVVTGSLKEEAGGLAVEGTDCVWVLVSGDADGDGDLDH